tara:strand:+ start:143 stop:1120 length:978 start_codon:yes stop_codon:yes gene_type:complete
LTFKKTREITVPLDLEGERLDVVAATLFPEFSRNRLQYWIKQGALRFEGEVMRSRDKVCSGGLIVLEEQLDEKIDWIAQEIDIDIIMEDDSIIVVNKPAGMVVHPAAGHKDGTLVNALLNHFPQLSKIPRAGIVHRLDQDTTGLLVVAKTLVAHNSLVSQIQERAMERQYCAVCVGVMTGGGTVNQPIGRHPRYRKKMAVAPERGKTAITHYRIARRFKHFSQINVQLETGRTHQIRVHMDHIRHPLVGDAMYGGKNKFIAGTSKKLIKEVNLFKRQALHARTLSFRHPDTAQIVSFEAPIPSDLSDLLALLGEEDLDTLNTNVY